MPDGGSGKTVYDFDTQTFSGFHGSEHFINRPLAFLFRLSFQGRRCKIIGAEVIGITNQLPNQVITDSPDIQVVFGQ